MRLCSESLENQYIIVSLKIFIFADSLKIEVNNKRVLQNEQHCIGKFRSRDGLEHILEVLQLTSHFSYKKDDEKNLVTIN